MPDDADVLAADGRLMQRKRIVADVHLPRRLFVVGVGRSGSSLLQSMLSAHPAVCFPPETGFIRRFVAGDCLGRVHRARGAAGVADAVARDGKIERLHLDRGEVQRLVEALEKPVSSAAVYGALLAQYAEAQGDAAWIGDKDPRLVEYLPLLKRLFPGAWVLHIYRDPRDVLVSKKKAEWSRGRSSLRHIFANRVQLKMGRRHGPRLFGERYREVAYEALIRDPEGTLNGICIWMGLDFVPAMLEFQTSSRELVSQDEMQWKKETLGPLLSANTGKWRTELAPWEVDLTQMVCREACGVLGYTREAVSGRFGGLSRLWLLPVAGAMVAADPLYRWYRRWRLQG